MTIYSLDVLLFLFGTSLLFHVQFSLLLPDLHIGFSIGRSGGLVFPSLLEFSTVYCDPHSQRLWFNPWSGTPLQYSCLENPRDGGAWWAAVYGVAQSRTRLKWLSSSKMFLCAHEKTMGPRHCTQSKEYRLLLDWFRAFNLITWKTKVRLCWLCCGTQ